VSHSPCLELLADYLLQLVSTGASARLSDGREELVMSVPIFDSTKPVYGTRQYVISSIRSLAAKEGLSLMIAGSGITIDVMCTTVGCAYEICLVLGRNERWRKTYDNPYHQHGM
jgi:hypothetical protein